MRVSDLERVLKDIPSHRQLPIQFRVKCNDDWCYMYEISAGSFGPGENGLTIFAGETYEPATVSELLESVYDLPADGELCAVLVDESGKEKIFQDVLIAQGKWVVGLIASE